MVNVSDLMQAASLWEWGIFHYVALAALAALIVVVVVVRRRQN